MVKIAHRKSASRLSRAARGERFGLGWKHYRRMGWGAWGSESYRKPAPASNGRRTDFYLTHESKCLGEKNL
jgi:hypothetical protein